MYKEFTKLTDLPSISLVFCKQQFQHCQLSLPDQTIKSKPRTQNRNSEVNWPLQDTEQLKATFELDCSMLMLWHASVSVR